MEWVRWNRGLVDRREVLLVAAKMNMSKYEAAGCFMALMDWADQESYDGRLSGVTPVALDRHIGVDGFASALETVGWLKVENGGICFVNWLRWNGQAAKRRALKAKRQSRYRASTHVDAGASPEKRIEESNTPHTPHKGGSSFKRKTAYERMPKLND